MTFPRSRPMKETNEVKHLTAKRVERITKILDETYPKTKLHNKANPLDEAIFILLTSQTDENKYLETWRKFRQQFPTMSAANEATTSQIYRVIKDGGLGRLKAKRIKDILILVKAKYNRFSLNSLKKLSNATIEKELLELNGIGIKSARCIMMYSLGRKVFPVDTHSLRVLKRLGVRVPRVPTRSIKFANQIQDQIPEKNRYRLHVTLIQHGREICTIKPKCRSCPVHQWCKYYSHSFADKSVNRLRVNADCATHRHRQHTSHEVACCPQPGCAAPR